MAGAVFNLDQRLCEMRPPRFAHGGVEYVGRLASWEQATRWGAEVVALGQAMDAKAPDVPDRLAALLAEITGALFPVPPAPPWWRRWARVPAAVDVVRTLHPTLQYELLLSFCEALATTMPRPPERRMAASPRTATTISRSPAADSPGSS